MIQGISFNNVDEDQKSVKQVLVRAYEDNLAEKLKAEIKGLYSDEEGLKDNKMGRWSTTWWEQFTVLLARGLRERRHESFSGLKIGEVLAVGTLAGLLWWQSDIAHLQDQVPKET